MGYPTLQMGQQRRMAPASRPMGQMMGQTPARALAPQVDPRMGLQARPQMAGMMPGMNQGEDVDEEELDYVRAFARQAMMSAQPTMGAPGAARGAGNRYG